MPILPNLPEAQGPQRTVRQFAMPDRTNELPLLQSKGRLALEPAYPRPGGVARVPPPETFGAQGPPIAREHMRKQFSHMANAGSHALNPMAADGTCAQWPPVMRTDPVSIESDFLHPCVARLLFFF